MINLSIIVPHYNSFKSLEVLLNTIPIIDQIEIIVVDDKSDQQLKKITELTEKYPHVHFLHNNKKNSAGVCRNIGLNKAKGKWLLFADADDFFQEHFYEKVSKYFNSDHDVIFFTPTSIDMETGKLSDRHIPYEKIINNFLKNNEDLFLRYRIGVPWSKLIRRTFIETNDTYFDEVMASNDIMFSAKVGYHMKKFTVSTEVIYCVTTHAGSLTNKVSEDILDSRVNVFIDYYHFLKKNLSAEDFKTLSLKGMWLIRLSAEHKLGAKKMLQVFLHLKRHQVKVFNYKYLNPKFLFKRISYLFSKHKKNKQYFK